MSICETFRPCILFLKSKKKILLISEDENSFKDTWVYVRVGPDIQPFSISGRIPDNGYPTDL